MLGPVLSSYHLIPSAAPQIGVIIALSQQRKLQLERRGLQLPARMATEGLSVQPAWNGSTSNPSSPFIFLSRPQLCFPLWEFKKVRGEEGGGAEKDNDVSG